MLRRLSWQRALALALSLTSSLGVGAATQTTTYQYTSQGQLAQLDGPRTDVADTTAFEYDAQGHLTALTNALGQRWQYGSYTDQDLPTSITDPNGSSVSLTYDGDGRLTSWSRDGQSWQFTYNALGQLLSSTNPAGGVSLRTYGTDHRLVSIQQPDDSLVEYSYDAMGNVTARRLSGGSVTIAAVYTYDELGRLLAVINSEGTTTRAYTYDAAGRMDSSRLAGPVSQTLQYDALNRLVSVTDELGYTHTTQYNTLDAVTQTRDGNKATTTQTVDALGQVLQRQSPDTGKSSFAYDNAGNVTQLTLADGTVIQRQYDALNRLTQQNVGSQASSHWTYDETDDNPGGIGELTSATSGTTQEHWRYNTAGQLLQSSLSQSLVQPQTGSTTTVTDTVTYTYSSAGQLATLRYPNGLELSYSMNSAGQTEGIDATVNGSSQTLVQSVRYAAGNRLTDVALGNALNWTLNYDANGQLSTQTLGSLRTDQYRYDANGQLTEQQSNSQTVQYGWDELQRLTQEQNAGGTTAYTYDAVGNRLQTLLNQSTSHSFGYVAASNRQNVVDGLSVYLNGMGQPSKLGSKPLKWRADGMLLESRYDYGSAPYVATYTYTAGNLRSSKVVQVTNKTTGKVTQTVTRYVYSPGGQLLYTAWQNTSGQSGAQSYVWLDNRPVAVYDQSNGTSRWLWLETDLRNAPQLAVDAQQSIVWRWTPDAFGQGSPETDPDGDRKTTDIVLRFPGQISDTETGLYYNWHRYYNPATGRYLSSDPLGLWAGENTYAYVGNDPLGSVDPYGLYSWDEFLDDSTNFSAGMGDAISFGATDLIRDAMGTNGVVNHCSGMYSSGEAAGIAVQYVIFKGRSVPESAVSEGVIKGAKPGEFNIVDWKGYPDGVPKPTGPVRLIEGTEYDVARKAANSANHTIRKENNLVGQPVDVHEVQPVKFGGSPTDPANKVIIDRSLHRQQVTPWWNQLQKNVGG